MSTPKHAAPPRVTFREVLAHREFRAVFTAGLLSWFGDYVARAAVTALVYTTSGSVALSAASFAIGYAPTLLFGPLLAALAERYPHRRLMIGCDLGRAAIIAAVALPGLPVPAVLVLLFAAAMLNPPFDASRSSLLPRLLDGDRYVVALSARSSADTTAMVVGYAVGGLLAPIAPHAVLAFDAVTFAASALVIARGTTDRDPVRAGTARKALLRETADGFRTVGLSPVLRAIALIVCAVSLFSTLPEALAASWASEITHGGGDRGLVQGLIMMAGPVGAVAGSVAVGRFVGAAGRRRLIRPLGVLAPLALVPMLFVHTVPVIAGLAALSSFGTAGLVASSNGLFVSAIPAGLRARAFGVMQFGLQLVQGASVLIVGVLGDRMTLNHAIGWWSLGGVALLALIVAVWPASTVIDDEVRTVAAGNAAIAAGPDAAPPAPRAGEPETAPGVFDGAARPVTDGPATHAEGAALPPGQRAVNGRHAARPTPRPHEPGELLGTTARLIRPVEGETEPTA